MREKETVSQETCVTLCVTSRLAYVYAPTLRRVCSMDLSGHAPLVAAAAVLVVLLLWNLRLRSLLGRLTTWTDERRDEVLSLERERLRAELEDEIRRDASVRSEAVTRGRLSESLAPYLSGFEFSTRDARFLGSPIDFVVFDGVSEDRCDRVVFVEVKAGEAPLSSRERRVREAVLDGRVEWREVRVELDD